jgi:hypothetical protein
MLQIFFESFSVALWNFLCVIISWHCTMWDIYIEHNIKYSFSSTPFLKHFLLLEIFSDLQSNCTFRSLLKVRYFLPNLAKLKFIHINFCCQILWKMHQALLDLLHAVRRRQKGRHVKAFRFYHANNGATRRNVR